MKEKRQHARAPIRMPLTCEIEGRPSAEGTATDISVGGAFVESQLPPPAFGTKVTLIGRVPGGGQELRLPGVVRWRGQSGFGVQFDLLGIRETHAIIAMIKKVG